MEVKYLIWKRFPTRTNAFDKLCSYVRYGDTTHVNVLAQEDKLRKILGAEFGAKLIGHDKSIWSKEDYILFPSEESYFLFLLRYS